MWVIAKACFPRKGMNRERSERYRSPSFTFAKMMTKVTVYQAAADSEFRFSFPDHAVKNKVASLFVVFKTYVLFFKSQRDHHLNLVPVD